MSSSSRVPSYVVRLRVRPKPTTLSESYAILKQLKTRGEVSQFAPVTKKSPASSNDDDDAADTATVRSRKSADCVGEKNDDSQAYSVVYSSIRPQPHEWSPKSLHESVDFTVVANAEHAEPLETDPFNVRGLLDRKPAPKPRTFTCTLTTAPERDSWRTDSVKSDFTAPFRQNRSSVFKQIFEQSTLPKVLHQGLLPKLDTIPGRPDVAVVPEPPRFNVTNRGERLPRHSGRHMKIADEVLRDDFSLAQLHRRYVLDAQQNEGHQTK